MSLGDNIRRIREAHGMTQEDFGRIAGVSLKAVSTWENNLKSPRMGVIQRIADYFNIPKSFIIDEVSFEDLKPKNHRVPVLGTIPAGIPMEAIEDAQGWEELPEAMFSGGKEYFALKINGDSMAPKYECGDIVILRKQNTCENGQDCAVMVNGDDATFKRVRIGERGIFLQPLNPAYEPLTYSKEEVEGLPVRIIGVAVEIRRTV
jgi:repressor LexA